MIIFENSLILNQYVIIPHKSVLLTKNKFSKTNKKLSAPIFFRTKFKLNLNQQFPVLENPPFNFLNFKYFNI